MTLENVLIAIISGISTPTLLVFGSWLGRKLNVVNAHLAKINGRLDIHDDSWQEQREINAYFAGKIGEAFPARKETTR